MLSAEGVIEGGSTCRACGSGDTACRACGSKISKGGLCLLFALNNHLGVLLSLDVPGLHHWFERKGDITAGRGEETYRPCTTPIHQANTCFHWSKHSVSRCPRLSANENRYARTLEWKSGTCLWQTEFWRVRELIESSCQRERPSRLTSHSAPVVRCGYGTLRAKPVPHSEHDECS